MLNLYFGIRDLLAISTLIGVITIMIVSYIHFDYKERHSNNKIVQVQSGDNHD